MLALRPRTLALIVWALLVGLAILAGATPVYWPPGMVPDVPYMQREVALTIVLLSAEVAGLYHVLLSQRLRALGRSGLAITICLVGLAVDQRWTWTHQSGAAYVNGYFLILMVFGLVVVGIGLSARRAWRASSQQEAP